MLWCQMGNWERLKQSAEHMPSLVAEKCYFLLDHYTSHLLSSNGVISTFGPKEANAINQMATSIKKLKNRSAINEAMEMFNFFLEFVKKQNPELLNTVTPLVEGYIASRRDTNVDSFVPHNFTADAKMDESIREQEIIEKWKDEDDQQLMEEEYLAFLKHLEEKKKENITPSPEHIKEQEAVNYYCHPEPVEGCHDEPRRTMTADDCTEAEETPTLALTRYTPGGGGTLTLVPALKTIYGEPSRTSETLSLSTLKPRTSPRFAQPPMSPLQTFAHYKFMEATAPKREPNCWSRLYKELKAIFPGEITTMEEFDELKFPPQRREEVLNILRAGTPIPGFEQLQLKLILEDKNKNNNNQNLAA